MYFGKPLRRKNKLKLQVIASLSKKAQKCILLSASMGQIMHGIECLFARDCSYTRHPPSLGGLCKPFCLDTSLILREHAGPTFFSRLSSQSGSYRGTTRHSAVTLPPLSCLHKKSGFSNTQ